MAQCGRQQQLLAHAVACLRAAGYSFSEASRGRFGRNVRVLMRGGESEVVLIQTRSHQPETSRYLVGIVVADMERVDEVVLYFEEEARYIKVPASFLRGIHTRMRERGLARYTGAHDQQWRVPSTCRAGSYPHRGPTASGTTSAGICVRYPRTQTPNQALQQTAGHDSFLRLQARRRPAAAELCRSEAEVKPCRPKQSRVSSLSESRPGVRS
jgi:hypothetical protein